MYPDGIKHPLSGHIGLETIAKLQQKEHLCVFDPAVGHQLAGQLFAAGCVDVARNTHPLAPQLGPIDLAPKNI